MILTVFGGGLFIPWNSTPIYWVWLQELSLFTQASRAALMAVMDNIDFKCPTLPVYGMCIADIGIYPCDAISPEGEFCNVSGRNILYRLQGSSRTDSPWIAFGYLVLIFVSLRLGILILMYYPVERITAFIKKLYSNGNDEVILKALINLRRTEGWYVCITFTRYRDAVLCLECSNHPMLHFTGQLFSYTPRTPFL